MNELNIGFKNIGQSALVTKAKHIVTSLTGNAAFPTPSPTLAVVQAAIDAYSTALAGDRTTANTALRQAKKDALILALQKLAANLETTADGDLVKLATTGFDLRKKPTRTDAEMPAPQNLRLKRGQTGEVFVTVAPVPSAVTYEVAYTEDVAKGPWTALPVVTSSRNIRVGDLEPKKDYWFRVRAIGTKGPSDWSDPGMITVL